MTRSGALLDLLTLLSAGGMSLTRELDARIRAYGVGALPSGEKQPQ